MATPATVLGDVRDAPQLTTAVKKLQGTDYHGSRTSVFHVTWMVVSGLEAYGMVTIVDLIPCSFALRRIQTI